MLDDMDSDDDEVEEGAPAWMATFSDMATLLLTFFVLLLSFANMDVVEFRTMMGSVRDAFGVQFERPGDFQARADTPVAIAPGGSPTAPSVLPQNVVHRVAQEVERRLRQRGLAEVVEVEATERGVVMRIRDAVLFESGSDALLPEAGPILTQVAEMTTEFTAELAVEGHTDDRPIHTTRFPSNWELSASRATAVLRHLSASGLAPERLSIAGFADTRPIGDNATVEGRAQNRRVEFVFFPGGRPETGVTAGAGTGTGVGAGAGVGAGVGVGTGAEAGVGVGTGARAATGAGGRVGGGATAAAPTAGGPAEAREGT